MPRGGNGAATGGVNLQYDMRHGFQRPGRPQEEAAFAQNVKRERRIKETHGRPVRPGTAGAPRIWSAGSDSTAPYYEDADAWRKELLRRDPNEASRFHSTHSKSKPAAFARMPTEEIRDVQRRAGDELERREWQKAVADFGTTELANLSDVLGDKIAQRQEAAYFAQNRIQPAPPPGVRPPWSQED